MTCSETPALTIQERINIIEDWLGGNGIGDAMALTRLLRYHFEDAVRSTALALESAERERDTHHKLLIEIAIVLKERNDLAPEPVHSSHLVDEVY